jgi:hypothetical protein
MESKNTACSVSKTGTFTLLELALEQMYRTTPEGFTVAEMSDAVGHGPQWCRIKLRKLIDAGRVELVGTKPVKRIDGMAGRTPVYRMVV